MNKIKLIAIASFVAILTSACGGSDGGSGSNSDNDDVTTPVEPSSPTRENEVLISEIMVVPALPKNLGEWFELQNPGANKLNLRDCVFEDFGGGNFSIGFELIIEPGGYKTFATSDSPNHVFVPDVIYDRSALTLNSPADILYLTCNGISIDDRNYTGAVNGRSSSLSNNDPTKWCDDRVNRYNGGTDTGTPGSANINC
jgi:hypothetical protein